MKKQIIKMSVVAAMVAGMMGSMSAAYAAPQAAADVNLRAVVTKTTCDISVDGQTGQALKTVDFGSFIPSDFATKTKDSPFSAAPFTLSFASCVGEDIAANGEVKLQSQGPVANGSAKTAYGDASEDVKVGFDLGLAWENDATTSATTAIAGTLDPTTPEVTIFSAKALTTAENLALPDVTVTPHLFTWDAANVGEASLNTTISIAVVYA